MAVAKFKRKKLRFEFSSKCNPEDLIQEIEQTCPAENLSINQCVRYRSFHGMEVGETRRTR